MTQPQQDHRELQPEPPIADLSEPMTAYLVHLLRTDIAAWNAKRSLAKADAEALVDQLAACLNPELRQAVYAMKVTKAA